MLLLSVASVAGCGFHLRGSEGAGLAGRQVEVYDLVASRQSKSLSKMLGRRLVATGVSLTSAGKDSFEKASLEKKAVDKTPIQLRLVSLTFSTRGVSRDATGRANEHQVTATLDYRIEPGSIELNSVELEASQQNLVELDASNIKTLNVSASYYQDYKNPSAGNVQRKETEKRLLEQLSQRLLRQLELKSSPNLLSKPAPKSKPRLK